MRRIQRPSLLQFSYLRHLSAFRTSQYANSLPVTGKSKGMRSNRVTELKYIPFWDNPIFGSVSRADGYARAQTQQIGPF
jgi:hypothetical protein